MTTRTTRRLFLAAGSAGAVFGTLGMAVVADQSKELMGDEREALLNAYDCWLENERRWLAWERAGGDGALFRHYLHTNTYVGHRADTYHDGKHAPASSRAERVLAAVGCAWRDDEK